MNDHLRTMHAEEVMNRDVQWADADENLRAAAERMAQHHIRTLLVRGDHEGDLPGILSSKDIVNLVGGHGVDVLDELHVRDACTTPAICVSEATHVHDCIGLMRMNGVRRMPVLRGQQVVGILSMSDIFARMLRA